jgi:glycosyltransferase involved in cell wall biosynthesis
MNSSKSRRTGRRVLMLVTDAYGGTGGIALYNRDVAQAFCLDPEVAEVVMLPRLAPNPMQPLPAKLRFEGSSLGGAFAYMRAVLRHVRSGGGFDLIYCGHINLAPVAWLASKLTGAPWMLTIYGIDAWKPAPRRIANVAMARADHVMALSDVTRQRFLKWSGVPVERTSVMHNAIHLEEFGMRPRNAALAARLGLDGRKVVMTLGRMDPAERYKGFDEILEILPRLAEKIPNITYVLAGDGADRPRLEAKAAELGVQDRARFVGFIPEQEKADLYRLADVYAMPSYGEGFGFVLIEAMACGVPTIASTEDGGREAVREGEIGRLVNPHSPDEVEAAILEATAEEKKVPEGLAYFAFPNFAQRMQSLAARLMGKAAAER